MPVSRYITMIRLFSEDLSYISNWRTSKNFDTRIICSDGVCRAHRLILCHISPYMGSLLDDQFPGEETAYSIPDVTKETMNLMLELAYTGKVTIPDRCKEAFEDAMRFLGWIRMDKLEMSQETVQRVNKTNNKAVVVSPEKRITRGQGPVGRRGMHSAGSEKMEVSVSVVDLTEAATSKSDSSSGTTEDGSGVDELTTDVSDSESEAKSVMDEILDQVEKHIQNGDSPRTPQNTPKKTVKSSPAKSSPAKTPQHKRSEAAEEDSPIMDTSEADNTMENHENERHGMSTTAQEITDTSRASGRQRRGSRSVTTDSETTIPGKEKRGVRDGTRGVGRPVKRKSDERDVKAGKRRASLRIRAVSEKVAEKETEEESVPDAPANENPVVDEDTATVDVAQKSGRSKRMSTPRRESVLRRVLEGAKSSKIPLLEEAESTPVNIIAGSGDPKEPSTSPKRSVRSGTTPCKSSLSNCSLSDSESGTSARTKGKKGSQGKVNSSDWRKLTICSVCNTKAYPIKVIECLSAHGHVRCWVCLDTMPKSDLEPHFTAIHKDKGTPEKVICKWCGLDGDSDWFTTHILSHRPH